MGWAVSPRAELSFVLCFSAIQAPHSGALLGQRWWCQQPVLTADIVVTV